MLALVIFTIAWFILWFPVTVRSAACAQHEAWKKGKTKLGGVTLGLARTAALIGYYWVLVDYLVTHHQGTLALVLLIPGVLGFAAGTIAAVREERQKAKLAREILDAAHGRPRVTLTRLTKDRRGTFR